MFAVFLPSSHSKFMDTVYLKAIFFTIYSYGQDLRLSC
jgi:hypothetical protein